MVQPLVKITKAEKHRPYKFKRYVTVVMVECGKYVYVYIYEFEVETNVELLCWVGWVERW